jgi:hypothetical protein
MQFVTIGTKKGITRLSLRPENDLDQEFLKDLKDYYDEYMAISNMEAPTDVEEDPVIAEYEALFTKKPEENKNFSGWDGFNPYDNP